LLIAGKSRGKVDNFVGLVVSHLMQSHRKHTQHHGSKTYCSKSISWVQAQPNTT